MAKIVDWTIEHPFEKLVNKKAENPFKEKYVRINREGLGENIARGREMDFIHNVNPLG